MKHTYQNVRINSGSYGVPSNKAKFMATFTTLGGTKYYAIILAKSIEGALDSAESLTKLGNNFSDCKVTGISTTTESATSGAYAVYERKQIPGT